MKHYKHSEGTAIIRLIPNKFNYSTYTENVSKTLLNFEDFHLLTFWDDVIIKEKLQNGGGWMTYVESILEREFGY
jgi:hypothetical protein